jgi:hypothetical protein
MREGGWPGFFVSLTSQGRRVKILADYAQTLTEENSGYIFDGACGWADTEEKRDFVNSVFFELLCKDDYPYQ